MQARSRKASLQYWRVQAGNLGRRWPGRGVMLRSGSASSLIQAAASSPNVERLLVGSLVMNAVLLLTLLR